MAKNLNGRKWAGLVYIRVKRLETAESHKGIHIRSFSSFDAPKWHDYAQG
jgi:hypothetical protein